MHHPIPVSVPRFAFLAVLAIAVAALLALALPDLAAAGPLQTMGRNTNTEVGGAAKQIFLVVIVCVGVYLAVTRHFARLAIGFILFALIAPLVMSPSSMANTFKDIGQSLYP